MNLSVLGGGKWGTTLAILYSIKYHHEKIGLWIRPESKYHNAALAEYVQKKRRNPKRIKDIQLPSNISVSDNLEEIADNSELLISTIPSEYLKNYLIRLKEANFSQFVNCSKGVIDENPISFFFERIMPSRPYAVISGPTIADDVLKNFRKKDSLNPSFATIAFDPKNSLPTIVSMLEFRPYFILSSCNDIKSVEYCSMLKQAYAVALGLFAGLGYNGNTVAALFHASGKEIKTILECLGKNPKVYDETYAGYPDLEVTYKFGRHGRLGRLIAKEGVASAKIRFQGECIEGFRIISSLQKLVQGSNLNLPIFNAVYSIISLEKDPETAVRELFSS